jgi:hypothetical protein
MNEENEELVPIPKEQFDMLVTKANIELIQRVNRMIELLEKNFGVTE